MLVIETTALNLGNLEFYKLTDYWIHADLVSTNHISECSLTA